MNKISPKQYAQAVYLTIKQDNMAAKVIKDLAEIENAIKKSSVFYKFLTYPKITITEKEKKLQELFKENIHPKTCRIILLLAKNNDLKMLDEIINELEKIKKQEEKILDINVYTPLPIEEDQKLELKKNLTDKTGKNITINEIIQPEAIGGIKIDLNGLIIDGTIAGELAKLQKSIKNI